MSVKMNRRSFLTASVGGVVGAGAWACNVGQGKEADPDAPNVLMIGIDDLNDWVGFLGHPNAKTPNLDALAARSVSFERAYCPAPLCNPSRSSMLTGLLPSNTGVYRNDQALEEILPDAPTLPEDMKDAGFATVAGGKVFHGSGYERLRWLSKRGAPWWMMRYVLEYKYGTWDDYLFRPEYVQPNPWDLGGDQVEHWAPMDVPEDEMPDMKVANWVVDRLSGARDEPYFAVCGFDGPHTPWLSPRKYFDAYRDEDLVLPEVLASDLRDVPPIPSSWVIHGKYDVREAVIGYLASVSYSDACVGRLLEGLDEISGSRETIVILWSDHGYHLGEKQHWGKRVLWEEATRIPFLVAVPGVTPKGVSCPRPVGLIDVCPTLADLCGYPVREEWDGVSIVPLLHNPELQWDRPAVMTSGPGNHSIRSERWRYSRYSDGTEELYDHDADPREWTNLAGESRFEDVKRDLARWIPNA